MTCPSCSHENRPSAKFCGKCGTPLSRTCSKCGSDLPSDIKFCDECGTPVSGEGLATRPAEPAGARKVVTILFADLVGSTALHERLDPESARRFMESYYALAREAVESHGGTLAKFLGDGAMAVFGIPRVAEDDAMRAVRAGVAMQETFHALAEQQRGAVGETGLRVALNTGEVVVKGEEVIGDPVNVAARLQERGRDGDVVIGESTRRLVASQVSLDLLGSFDLKGRAEAVKAYRVVSLDAPGRAATTAFVGRDEELARITAVYDRAVEKPATHLAVLLGSPGLGKSRLLGEFARRGGETATVIAAHCDAAGGATFAPLADALRELLGIDAGVSAEAMRTAVEAAIPGHGNASADPSAEASAKAEAAAKERARIAAGIAGILTGSPGAPEETFFVVRRFLAGLATTRPVVLMIDDLQWAEPLLFDLVEHLVQWGRGLPVLVLIGARPELREVRSSFTMSGGLVADVVTLDGLDASAAMRLAAGVIGATDLPAAVAAKVLATSEGNPLFIGELVRMLVDEGALIRDGDRWKTGATLATVEMPPTIHALLGARIERLHPQQCVILERAAVVGRQFSRSAVVALLPSDGTSVDAELESLQRAQLIERDTGWLLGEPVLRFHHVLIRDAAYRRLLKGTRAELHERLANWIEERAGEAPEHDETIGRHLEEAHRLLGELGPIDDDGQLLGGRAATRLAAAGRRALEGDDAPLAAGLLGRALDRLKVDDPGRADLALDWCEALLAAGDVGAAAKAIEELGHLAEVEGSGGCGVGGLGVDATTTPNPQRLQAWHTCFVGHHTVLTAPKELSATADLVAAAATSLAFLNDAAGEAKGHFVHALALARLGRVGACEGALDRALAAARRAGDRRRANTVLAIAPLAALWGPSPVTRASGRCLDVVRVLRITQGAPAVEAVALSCQGVLEALRGRTEAAHRMIASGRDMVEELGIAQRLFDTDVFAGFVALLEDDVPTAERTLRGAYDGLRDLGLGIDAARAAALLARALLAQDRSGEAEALSHESEALAGDDLKAAIAWRGVRAEALARRGEHGAAIELAKAGVEIAAATDALLDHADARLALAAALRAAGRGAEADAEDRHAIGLWEAKGATLLAARAQQPATKPVRPDRSPVPRPVLSNAEGGDCREGDLPASKPPPGPLLGKEGGPVRRVRLNAASTLMKGIEAGFAAGDKGAIEALLADPLHTLEHLTGATYGRQGQVESVERMLRLPNLEFRLEVLATLGGVLCLGRRRVTASGTAGGRFDVAAYEMDHIVLSEADERGRLRLAEVFATDHLGDALVRLYELYAESLPGGSARTRAAAIARFLSAYNGPIDPDRIAAGVAPASRNVDHRVFGTWTTNDAADTLRHHRYQLELAADFAARFEDVLALAPDVLLTRMSFFGTARDGGGAFANRVLLLFTFGADGCVGNTETFEAEQEDEALARFDELTGRVGGEPFDNAASRADREFVRRFNARDWAGIEALAAPQLVFDERRRMLHDTCGREVWLEQLRVMFDVPESRFTTKLLATRGQRLALSLPGFAGEVAGGGGPLAMDDHFALNEVDGQGRIVAIVLFDLEAEDAAYAELERRWAGSDEGATSPAASWTRRFQKAFAARDWDAFAALSAPNQIAVNHRLVGWGTLRGYAAWVPTLPALVELAPNTRFRLEHLRTCEHGFFWRCAWYGERDGGAFETPFVLVCELDSSGLQRRLDLWDVEDLDKARARFAELARLAELGVDRPPLPGGDHRGLDAEPPPNPLLVEDGGAGERRFANAATRAVDRGTAALAARDWEAFAALMAPGFRHYDRTRIAQLESDGREWLAAFRRMVEMTSAPPAYRVLATRGERLALFEMLWRGAGGDIGPSEIDWRLIVEVNERGEHVAIVVYDPDDLDAAYAELDARFEAEQGDRLPASWTLLRRWIRAVADRDWEGVASLCADDLVEHDHRSLSVLGVTRGIEPWIQVLRTVSDLAPDSAFRIHHFIPGARGYYEQGGFCGTREGGPFEIVINALVEIDDHGLLARIDLYDDDRVFEASRWAELGIPVPPAAPKSADLGAAGPTVAKANAASAAMRRWSVTYDHAAATGDWDAMRELCAPHLVFDDRRRLALLSGGLDLMVASARARLAMGARPRLDLLGMAGERIAIERVCWSGGPADGPFEIEYLGLWEIDETGQITAMILFDVDEGPAVRREAWRRWAAIEPVMQEPLAVISGLTDRFNDGDRAGVRALCADDLFAEDHRRTGIGRIDGADAYMESLVALWDLAPDQRLELSWHWPVYGPHGGVTVVRRFGTLPDGGAFESEYLVIFAVRHGRVTHLELFELDDLERALARFEELRPQSSDTTLPS